MYGEHSIRAAYRPYAERAHRRRSQAVADLWNDAVTDGARLSRRILADLRRWHERRKNVRDLSALADRHLKDIGIGRSEILYVVQEGARLSIPDGRTKLAPNACAPIRSPGTRRFRAAGYA